MILILTNRLDRTSRLVAEKLAARNADFLFVCPEDWPTLKVTFDPNTGVVEMRTPAQDFALAADPVTIWNRRMFVEDKVLAQAWGTSETSLEFSFMKREWYAWMRSLCCLGNATWINHPDLNRCAEVKVEQLIRAKKLGFQIPRTLASNDAERIRAFAGTERHPPIVKALSSGSVAENEFVFTTVVEATSFEDAVSVQRSPFFVQEALVPKIDYRVTLFGDQSLVCAISAIGGRSPPVDWRSAQQDYHIEHAHLPPSIESACFRLANEYGLKFAAIDLVEHEGRFYFIEINPNGEWGWLETQIGPKPSDYMVNLLLNPLPGAK